MSYWDYDEPVWEPSEADELFDEMKSKLVEAEKLLGAKCTRRVV